MRLRITIILFLLIFSLLIQNTCPHGFAGKSTVASTCSHCPQAQVHNPAFEGTTISSIARAPAHLPMFVLDMPNTLPTFRFAVIAIPQHVIPHTYKNTTPDELLQPPRA